MAVAVIICTRDRPALLAGAVAAAAATRRDGDELVVVDSASRDRGAVAAIAVAAGARVVRCDAAGASRARNAGAAATLSPVLAFTDDDCRPRPGWIDALERALGDPSTGFATGRVLPDREGGRALSVVLDEAERTFVDGDDPAAAGSGANMGVRRDAFEQVRGFDEEFGPGARFHAAEDHELFWRLLHAGWRGRYAPDAVVVHEQWRGLGAFLLANHRYGMGSGALAAKVRSVDRARGKRLLRAGLGEKGARRAWEHARSGYELGALASLLSATGVAVGAARAARHHWAEAPPRARLADGVEGGGELGGHVAP